jgi:hypothetical protein
MKRKIMGLLIGMLFICIGYNVSELIIPDEVKASEQVLEGKQIVYHGLPGCDCRNGEECLCIVDK